MTDESVGSSTGPFLGVFWPVSLVSDLLLCWFLDGRGLSSCWERYVPFLTCFRPGVCPGDGSLDFDPLSVLAHGDLRDALLFFHVLP